jgi:hypothetical protein
LESLSFRSKYVYSSSPVGIELPITLALHHRAVRLLAKVDTGAAFCIFQREYAEQLGIVVEQGEPKTVSTATGEFTVYGHSVTLSCLDEFTRDTTAYFAAMPEFKRKVVGRIGWLQHFRLGIVENDETLFLSYYDD